MTKRKRRYKCKHCGLVVTRVSDKQWIESDCATAGKTVHMMLIRKGKK